jgi:hypothetical protein
MLMPAASPMLNLFLRKTVAIFVSFSSFVNYSNGSASSRQHQMLALNSKPCLKKNHNRGASVTAGRFLHFCAVMFLLLGLPACQSDPRSARGVAERFLDTHYVQIDLLAAKAVCTGLALNRVEDEIRLTRGAQIDEQTRPPHVHYRLLEEKNRGEKSASLLYETIFSVDGAGQFTKKILLTLRQNGEGWRVANFKEFD